MYFQEREGVVDQAVDLLIVTALVYTKPISLERIWAFVPVAESREAGRWS